MPLSRKSLSIVKHYSIDLVTKDPNTFSVQISDVNDQSILADLPLDPMDNTLAAVINKNTISKLGADAVDMLAALSKVLQEQIGAKEFVVLPAGAELTGYVLVQNAEFKRLRHASRNDLQKSTSAILALHSDIVTELDAKIEFVVGMTELTKKLHHDKPYEEIFALLEGHANFTPSKMTEYKDEDILGKKCSLQ